MSAPLTTADRCEWLAGCDEMAAYRTQYEHCDDPECLAAGKCLGALVCETHAATERTHPDLVRITALVATK